MEENKKAGVKKDSKTKKTTATKKNETKKAEKAKKVNSTKNKVTKKDSKKKEEIKEVVKEEVKKEKLEVKPKKENKLKKWFDNLTLEQLIIGGVIVIAILLIILIAVSTKNTKTKDGDDIVIKIDGKTITADDLYKELKAQNGQVVAINMIDDYILDKEYKTTDDMKESAEATIETYKSTYGDNFQSFLEYNGLRDESELKELLIKNTKLGNATDDYIKENLSEKELKEYYEKEIVGDIKASHILISFDYEDDATDEEKEKAKEEAKKKAEEIIQKLKDGAKFADLAKEYSEDESTKKNGGDLGYFNKGEMEESFEKAAYDLKVNEYTTTPIETSYGYHVILKTEEKEKPSYEKSKDTIIEKLIEEKKNEDSTISVKAMASLREKYNMVIKDKTVKSDYETYIKNATTTTTTTTSSN